MKEKINKNHKPKFINSQAYYVLIVLYLLFTLIVAVFSHKLFGDYYSFTNKSNSMNPSINSGSIIIVKKYNSYNTNDIISYYAQIMGQEEIITHRIVALGGNVYVTKGDANVAIDRETVIPRLVIGRVILIIPYLGYIISLAKSPLGLWLSIFLPALIIIGIELYKIIKEINKS